MNLTTIKTLIKIKNASILKKNTVIIPYNTFYLNIIQIFYLKGLIQSYTVIDKINIKIRLRTMYNKCLSRNIKIVSTPTLKRYFSFNKMIKIKTKNLFLFFSTTKGLLTLDDCLRHKIGGVLLFIC